MDATPESTARPDHRDSEQVDSESPRRLVGAYCGKHPESNVVFGIVTSEGSDMEIADMGDPALRKKIADRLRARAVASIEKKRGRILVPAASCPRGARILEDQTGKVLGG